MQTTAETAAPKKALLKAYQRSSAKIKKEEMNTQN